jgi:quinol monooxygenase YgiN
MPTRRRPDRKVPAVPQNYGLLVRFRLRDGAAEAFDQLVADTVEQIAKHEPGTLVYTSHAVRDRPNERVFYELYQDEAAFVAHEEQPHTRHFLEQRGRHVESYDVDVVTPLAGHRL